MNDEVIKVKVLEHDEMLKEHGKTVALYYLLCETKAGI